MNVRLLEIGDVDRYLQLVSEVEAGSGVGGEGHSHAYTAADPHDPDAAREREILRWSTPISDAGWRRAWGLFDRDELVGELDLAGAELTSERHRVDLGMGVRLSHRRRGGGSQLLDTAVDWARGQPTIDWIDLSVFSDNPGAQALYLRHGFQILGRTTDRYRVDGCSLDDIPMALNVATRTT